MNALKKFYVLGVESADRRVAGALAPPPLDAVDRYLKESAVVAAVDRLTLRLQALWLTSAAKQRASAIRDRVGRQPRAVRRRAASLLIMIAVIVHVSLTLLQGAPTGWFWMIIPGMAALFAAALSAGSRASGPAD
jgi:hypothetical protein